MQQYTGSVQTFTAPHTTTYKLEVWGAQGGTNSNGGATGGKGGYSKGKINTKTNFYICVGNAGGTATTYSGGSAGYNGGGKGGNGYNNSNLGGGGGGGATHIAITNDRGVLANYKDKPAEVLIVAGGGGGAAAGTGGADKHSGGPGGGNNGGNSSTLNSAATISQGASQSTGYSFGKGQDGFSKTAWYSSGAEGNGGGGGGWYGGYSYQGNGLNTNAGGGGGSGYLNTSKITNSSTTVGVQSGAGKALITWMPVLQKPIYLRCKYRLSHNLCFFKQLICNLI